MTWGKDDRRRPRGLVRALAGAALALLLSCGSEGATEDAWALVGAGETRFVPLADGADIELVAGAQGGWHLWVSARAGGFGDRARMHTALEPEGWDGPRQATWRQVALEPVEGEPWRARFGEAAVLSYAPCFVDRPLHLTLTLSDESGRLATDERILVVRAPSSPAIGECLWAP